MKTHHLLVFLVNWTARTTCFNIHHDFLICRRTDNVGFGASIKPAGDFDHKHKSIVHNNQSFSSAQPSSDVPSHIAFICDGNSRWATSQSHQIWHSRTQYDGVDRNGDESIKDIPHSRWLGSRRSLGHAQGADRVISTTQHIRNNYPEVRWITMYAFSTENWSRPDWEKIALFQLMERCCDDFSSWAAGNLIVKVLGDLEDKRIPMSLRKRLKNLELDSTLAFQASPKTKLQGEKPQLKRQIEQPLTLCIAINYGGRNDIIQATKNIAEAIRRGDYNVDDINDELFNNRLYTSGIPPPELVIRTGGEQRISNFLLWQSAYSELYFTDTLWPDFNEKCLDEAIRWFRSRERRFGGHA